MRSSFLKGVLGFAALLSIAQAQPEIPLHVGAVVVASRELRDRNFAQAVILVTKYDEEGTVGLIVNRQSDVPISSVLEDWKEAKGRKEPVFLGGPVEKAAIFALLRSAANIEHAQKIAAGVHLSSERPLLQKNLAGGSAPDKFRIYLGYAGWGPEQLEDEIEAGAWHIFPADANLIFDPDPDSLWKRLIQKTETRIALRRE